MSWITDALSKILKRSIHPGTNGMVVPQGYNTDSGEWIPVRVGPNGELLTTLTGSILGKETNKAVTANTDILTDYNASKTIQTTLMVATNTSGILKLEVDGSLNELNGGVALATGKWYAFDIPVLAESVYNLQFTVNATMQIKWIGGF